MTTLEVGPTLGRPGNPTPGGPTPSPQPSGPKAPPTPPPPKNADLLDEIDAQLVGLLAIAYFGPAEQGTATSVDQACAAEILLFRLRAARRAVAELREAYGIKLPARRAALSPVGGLGSTPVRQEPAGAAVAADTAVTESRSAVVAAAAGAQARAGGVQAPAGIPGAPTMPKSLGPPSFQVGTARMGGARC